jgi:orotidine-5'-phosphate decarboxylase
MSTNGLELEDRVIWSADVEDDVALASYVSRMPRLRVVKLDRNFLTGRRLDVIGWVADELGKQVFVDAKIVEIASKVVEIAKKYLAQKPWMLNCMADIISTGDMSSVNEDNLDALKRFAVICHAAGTLPCAVSVLTNKTSRITQAEFGRPPAEQVLWYAWQLMQAGFADMVCSPREADHIRADQQFDGLRLIVPSIRLAGSSAHDQARTATPRQAIEWGADRLVIGRDLTKSDDPAATFEAILAEIRLADQYG